MNNNRHNNMHNRHNHRHNHRHNRSHRISPQFVGLNSLSSMSEPMYAPMYEEKKENEDNVENAS